MKKITFFAMVVSTTLPVLAQRSTHELNESTNNINMEQTTNETARIMEQFNNAFQKHNSKFLDGLIAEDCVMESIQGPDGVRHEGFAACYEFWSALARDPNTYFDLEEVEVYGESATIKWRYHWGKDKANAVRGVNLMKVRNGKIVEALGYAKTVATTGLDENDKLNE
jgi:hypothetical protein